MSKVSSARKPPGRPAVNATPVNVRFPPDELAALDAYVEMQPAPKPTRAGAIRQIIAATLAFAGRK